ncbi:sigma-70 family RNA polymerase sigma factor [Novosphingobium sp. NPDC080210]|uniref:sigma-70 family RNA polymerase sigma factor n=1 Tax=unclassified Novosphingobium TaxID=2644732 RepID=UPI0035B1FAE8
MRNPANMIETAERLNDKDFHAELERITPHLRAFARTLCGCRERADDLAQETLLKAWAARESYRAGTNFKAWTFTILRNQFYSEARRARFTGEYDQDMAERTLCSNGNQEHAVELADVLRALETLPGANREALILAAVGDLAYEEIAEICGIALGTVKSRICRARMMLVAALDGGVLPDSRHDFVIEGNALDLLFIEMRRAANSDGKDRLVA